MRLILRFRELFVVRPAAFGVPVLLLMLALTLPLACRRAASEPQGASFSGPTMGTWYNVKLAAPLAATVESQLREEIARRLEEINGFMSTYRPDSEISRFNRHTGSEWFDVSPETAAVVAAAQQISAETDGAFDITVGPLVNLWNFGPNPQPDRLPSDEEIQVAMQQVGYGHVEARTTPPALRKSLPGVYIDLSAIAKGFAVDEIARLLDQHGILDYMVEIGGEVRTRGTKDKSIAWRIGIEKPVSTGRYVAYVVELVDRSLATSGDYRNYYESGGKRYSHEIDPRTGRPVEHVLASVSVLSDDCMTADAVATAMMVMGVERAMRYAKQKQLDVLLIQRHKDEFLETCTPGFEAAMQEQ